MQTRQPKHAAGACIVLLCAVALAAFITASAQAPASKDQVPGRFIDATEKSGIKFLHQAPHTSRKYLLETMGSGVALFDCDNDGKLDIAVINDSTIDRYQAGGDPMVTLYHQDGSAGNIHFTDVTSAAGLTTRGWGMAVVVGDYDNDGLPDLYVTGYGSRRTSGQRAPNKLMILWIVSCIHFQAAVRQ